MKSQQAQILAVILLVLWVTVLAFAQGKHSPQSTASKKQTTRKMESREATQSNSSPSPKCDASQMNAETGDAIGSASRRGDFATSREIVRKELRKSPNVCVWYVLLAGLALRSPLDNDADIDELLSVINEFQRRKLPSYDDSMILFANRRAYEWKSKLAIGRGEFDKGIAALRKLGLLGDPASKAESNLYIGFAYLKRYVKTQSRSDAAIVRDELRAALDNKVGLEKITDNDSGILANTRMLLGAMENDLGNYRLAVSELELAQSLDPSNSEISKMLSTARENLQGGGKGVRFVSIQDIVDMLGPSKRP